MQDRQREQAARREWKGRALPASFGKKEGEPDAILGVVSGSSVNIWFMHSVINTFVNDAETKRRFNADWLLVFGPYIHQNRNELQRQFIESVERDWLFVVDNDMVWSPEDVNQLFAVADEKGPGIYAAPYLIENGTMTCGPWDDENPVAFHPLVGLPSKPTPIGVVGMGFTLVHREVILAVGDKGFSQIANDVGEDVSFCYRAKEAGFIPWLVPACDPGHFKQVALFPHGQVRNTIGDDVNLVLVDKDQMEPGQILHPEGAPPEGMAVPLEGR